MNSVEFEYFYLKTEAYRNAVKAFSSLALLAKNDSDKEYYEAELNKYDALLKPAENKLEQVRLEINDGKE